MFAPASSPIIWRNHYPYLPAANVKTTSAADYMFSFPGGQHDGGGSCCQPGAAAGSARDLATTVVDGKIVPIIERVIWERPLCKLLHFEKQFDTGAPEPRQRLLIVAPMSGHHATLLRGHCRSVSPLL